MDNSTTGMIPTMDVLDESKPPWWKSPPQELTNLTAIFPRIRTLRQSPGGRIRHQEKQAYLLTFNHAAANPNGSFPDITNPWY